MLSTVDFLLLLLVMVALVFWKTSQQNTVIKYPENERGDREHELICRGFGVSGSLGPQVEDTAGDSRARSQGRDAWGFTEQESLQGEIETWVCLFKQRHHERFE